MNKRIPITLSGNGYQRELTIKQIPNKSVFLCGIVCNCVFLCVPVRIGSKAWGKMKMVKTGEKSNSDQKTVTAQ